MRWTQPFDPAFYRDIFIGAGEWEKGVISAEEISDKILLISYL